MKKINFIFGVHNHQPVGNFDFVFAEALEKAYKPFFEILRKYPDVKIMAHFSGCLADWLEENSPEYFDAISELVEKGQLEMLGSGYYEPILMMIPEHDLYEQIKRMEQFIKNRLHTEAKGIWLTERVWEPYLAKPLVKAGVKYAVIDDYHFKSAGYKDEDINGYFTTEHEGYTLSLFPISERLRYLIPFSKPEDTIEYLRSKLNDNPNHTITMIDDGEKFGIWPHTFDLVYEQGWLEKFFKLLTENRDWLHTTHCSEIREAVPPNRLVHLPNNSYFEMSVWSLPAEKASELESLQEELQSSGEHEKYKQFLRGGIWRGFLSKYSEVNTMQKWMLKISHDIEGILGRGDTSKKFLSESREHLLRGQCNCPYWHGVFGGLYLPHLRHAVYSELVKAQKSLDQMRHRRENFLKIEEIDIDSDGRNEVVVNNRFHTLIFKPSYGGSLNLLANKENDYNLQNLIARRYEHYHDEIISSHDNEKSDGTSIHELARDISEEVQESLIYDWYPRHSLLDHFFGPGTNVDNLYSMEFNELGDFVNQPYEANILQTPKETILTLMREGNLHIDNNKIPLKVTKNVYIRRDDNKIRTVYKYTNLHNEPVSIHAGVEFNLFLLGGEDMNKSLIFNELEAIKPLDQKITAGNVSQLKIEDLTENFTVTLKWNVEGGCFVFPVKTVSQSEGGYDLIYQGSSVIPNWRISLEPGEESTVAISILVETLQHGLPH